MNKTKFFIQLITKLDKKLNLPKIMLWKDNRLGKNYIAGVIEGFESITKQKVQIIRYNEKLIQKMPIPDIIHAVFHEIGHIKTKGKNLIEREYNAEKFALKNLKKYFPKYYSNAIKYIEHICKYQDKVYAQAFNKLLKEVKK